MSFTFKQFTISDDQCAMKVGTDGVLLGAWTRIGSAHRILDIGTGSGMIAVMLAQRTSPDAIIDAVEISAPDAGQARENVLRSPWPEKVIVHHTSIQAFAPDKRYDLIVSNPPYFSKSFLPPSASRGRVRHNNTLDHGTLVQSAMRLLTSTGTLSVILPTAEGNEFVIIANNAGLVCNRELAFYSREGKAQERWLFEFSRDRHLPVHEKLILHGQGDTWSEDYKRLTRDFYLYL